MERPWALIRVDQSSYHRDAIYEPGDSGHQASHCESRSAPLSGIEDVSPPCGAVTGIPWVCTRLGRGADTERAPSRESVSTHLFCQCSQKASGCQRLWQAPGMQQKQHGHCSAPKELLLHSAHLLESSWPVAQLGQILFLQHPTGCGPPRAMVNRDFPGSHPRQ